VLVSKLLTSAKWSDTWGVSSNAQKTSVNHIGAPD